VLCCAKSFSESLRVSVSTLQLRLAVAATTTAAPVPVASYKPLPPSLHHCLNLNFVCFFLLASFGGRFTNETFVKSKIQVATPHSMAPHSQLVRPSVSPSVCQSVSLATEIINFQLWPGHITHNPWPIYSHVSIVHGPLESSSCFVIYAHLLCGFSTAFRLVVDQLKHGSESESDFVFVSISVSLSQSLSQTPPETELVAGAINKFAYDWTHNREWTFKLRSICGQLLPFKNVSLTIFSSSFVVANLSH